VSENCSASYSGLGIGSGPAPANGTQGPIVEKTCK
jgi:hypothetical protein